MVAKEKARISVVIPARNEEDAIGEVVRGVLTAVDAIEVIVVDDGSEDATAERASEAGAQVLRNPYNVGNGASVRRGALATSGDIIVFLDGDNQHPPDEIPRLLGELGEYDMVVGARTRNSNTSTVRNVGNYFLNRVARWISGQRVDDLTSGFRAIKRKRLMEFIHLFPRGYSYPTTITLAIMMAGGFVHYVPLDTIKRRKTGKSEISPVKDFFKFIAIIIRIIVLFSPQKIFAPLGIFLFLLSAVVSGLQLWSTGGIQSAGLALFLSSVYIVCFGILADQLSLLRRQRHR